MILVSILHPAMEKIPRKIGLFNLGMVTDIGEGNLRIQTSCIPLKT